MNLKKEIVEEFARILKNSTPSEWEVDEGLYTRKIRRINRPHIYFFQRKDASYPLRTLGTGTGESIGINFFDYLKISKGIGGILNFHRLEKQKKATFEANYNASLILKTLKEIK